jgi:hypothetical protein
MDRKLVDVTQCFQWVDGVDGCWNLVANQILKNGMFSNTAKHFSQRANKYNYAILRFQSILANISSTKQWKMHRKFR